jgi:hypothetical protein
LIGGQAEGGYKKKDKTMASLSSSTGPVVLKKRVSSREKSRSENYKVSICVCAQIQVISSSFNSLSPHVFEMFDNK